MTSRVSDAGLAARMLRSRAGGSLLVSLLCVLLAAAGAAVPLAVAAVGDATVRQALDGLAPGARDLEGNSADYPQIGSGTTDLPEAVADQWGLFDARLEQVRTGIEPPLGPFVGAARYVVRTPALNLPTGEGRDSVSLTLDPRFAERAALVEGAWPAAPARVPSGTPQGELEIALSADSAARLEWEIGETRAVVPGSAGELSLRLTATFDAAEGSEDYWYHVPSVLTPRVQEDNAGEYIFSSAYAAPEALEVISTLTAATTQVWYPLDTRAIEAGDAPTVLEQLRQFTGSAQLMGTQADGFGILTVNFTTSSLATIEQALATTQAMTVVIALTAAGPVGVAAAVMALACRVVSRRRRPALSLLAARGASRARLRGLLAVEGLVYGIVPSVVGVALVWAAAIAVGLAPDGSSLIGPVLVAILPAAILWATPPPPAGLRDGDAAEGSLAGRSGRIVLEVIVVGAAALATAALVAAAAGGDRIGSTGGASPAAGAELLVVATPLLLGLVGCVIALRAYPLPLRALLVRLARGRGFVGFLGAARALRDPAAGVAPVLALVIGMSVAVSSGILLSTIQHGIDGAASAEVGADLQIAGVDLPGSVLDELRGIPGVGAVAGIAQERGVYVRSVSGIDVMGVLIADSDELRAAQDPDHPLLPDGVVLTGNDDQPVPVVLSEPASASVEGETEILLDRLDAEVEAVSDASSPVGMSARWVLVDQSLAVRVVGDRVPGPTAAFVAVSPGADAAAVETSVRALLPDATVTSPSDRTTALSAGAGIVSIRVALITATGTAALLGALAVMLTLALGTRARVRVVALLGVLGARPGAARGLVAWELGPPLVAALVVGTTVGVVLPALLLATIDLRAFTGPGDPPGYHIDPLVLGAAIGGFLALTALFTVVALALSRRVRAASLLRTSQEG